ncbi:MAG: hypothetical protein KBT41_05325, partial [bacterium]|nr:hypothetical protein [Candidatus Colousia faecequi]
TGNYFDTLLSRNGCDSVYELRLIVYSQNMTTVNLQLCNGNVITINGRRITTPGIYYDTLMRNSFGCDSIIKYVVSTPPNYIHEDTVYICEGSSYTFFGQTFNMPGTYYHTVPQAAPLCDEIYKLVLKTHERYYTVIDTTICANTVLIFNGTRITTSGTYYENYTTIYGCDSIRELNVTVNQPSYYTERVDICQKQSFRTPTGKILNTRGVFNDTLLNHVGCDSILTYIVNVYDNIRISDTLLICRGGSGVARNGLTYSAAGDYVDTVNRNTANGCDTMFFTHVAYDVTQVPVPATICNGDTFMFHGTAYTHAGTYTLFEQSMTAGICDVLYTITVTVNQVPHTLLVDTTCDNTPYAFNGNLLTVSGTYRDTLMAANGCDSIVTLNLTVFDSLTVDSTVTICDKDSLLWFGRWYKYDGVYHHTTLSPSSGCNIYHTLYLTTIKETQLVSVNNQEMCQDEDEYFITPTFAGTAPTRFTLRYDGVSVPSSNDLVDEWYDGSSITVPIPRTADGKRITPDNYTVTLQIGNDNCGMGRQTMNFNLLVKYPSYLLEQHFNDVVSVLNYKYNGGYSFEDYRWYVNGTKVANADKSNLYNLHLSPNDVVYAELRRKGESYFIPTCEITIVDLGQDDIDYPIAVVSGRTTAQVTAKENATYRLCTISGVTLQSGELAKNEVVNLNLPYVAGCYLFVVDAETAGRKVFRLVVH